MSHDYSKNFISGNWRHGKGESFSSISPVNGEKYWEANSPSNDEMDIAIDSAHRAFEAWSLLDISNRLSYLESFVAILEKNKNKLANLISKETGKPLWEATTEVSAMIGKLEPTKDAASKRNREFSRDVKNGVCKTRFRPHGVVLVIGPYNFPGHMPNGHIMPALLAGNTVIFKPSEYAPAVAEQTIKFWEEAGLPKGVITLLQGGPNISKYLCSQKNINAVFFTGSRKAGHEIGGICNNNKICALEMGGNSPLIVWDASNINAAVLAAIQSAYITSGQRCSAARRIIVPNCDFGDQFLSKFASATKKIKVGRFDDDPQPYMGPVRNKAIANTLFKEYEKLIQRGAVPIVKCMRLPQGDCFISPGILDVTSVIDREDKEIMGPLVQIIRVNNFDEAISEANNTNYGLAAGLFTEDRNLYLAFEREIKAGIINWNQQLTGASGWAPFGGIKQSGNYRPSAYLAADYCVYSTASIELPKVYMPSQLPQGLESIGNE